jgi:hypothetical protein
MIPVVLLSCIWQQQQKLKPFLPPKGQLISKANFQVVDSPKKRTNGV